MSATYLSAQFYGPGDLRLEALPLPDLWPGEVLVKIGAALTCGTDRKSFKRGHPVLFNKLPSPFGHEMAGSITTLGKDVANWKIGDRVVVANSAPCENCFFCQKNEPNLCENLVFLNGAFAEYLRVPAAIVSRNLHKIPDALSFADAALAEPLACVLHAVQRCQIKAGETVAIIGTGPMGFLFVDAIKALGARPILIGRNPQRLDLAKSWPTETIDSTAGDPVQTLKNLTQGHGADVTIEAVGQPETWTQALGMTRKGGRVCLYGGCAKGTEFNLDTYRVHYEELAVFGIFHHTPTIFARAVKLLSEGKIKTSAFTSTRHPLSQIVDLFLNPTANDPLKSVIEP